MEQTVWVRGYFRGKTWVKGHWRTHNKGGKHGNV